MLWGRGSHISLNFHPEKLTYLQELQQPKKKINSNFSLTTYAWACGCMCTLMFLSCEMIHMPKSASFCTLCVCISAVLRLKALNFCDTKIYFTVNQASWADGEKSDSSWNRPCTLFGFFSSLKNISSAPQVTEYSRALLCLSYPWILIVPLLWVIHGSSWPQVRLQQLLCLRHSAIVRCFRPHSLLCSFLQPYKYLGDKGT